MDDDLWNDAMQRSIWRLRNQGLNAREIAARFDGVTKEEVRAFIQSGKPPRPTVENAHGH